MSQVKRYALFGHPVRHSLSPAMFEAAFAATGSSCSYTAVDVPSAGTLARLVDEVRRGMLAGANVTLPHKRAVLALADEIAPSAVEARAANVLARGAPGRVVAHNTDAQAIAVELAREARLGPASRAVVLGSGGAALAAVSALRKLGVHAVGVTSRSFVDADALMQLDAAKTARDLGALTFVWPDDDVLPSGLSSAALRDQWREFAASANLVVQATSAGVSGGPDAAADARRVAAVVPFESLAKHALAFDLVYRPAVTPFLERAAARGLRCLGGLGMLIEQAALAHALWTGTEAPRAVMRDAAERVLARG